MANVKRSVQVNRREDGIAFLRNYFDLACYTHRVVSKALYLRFNRCRHSKLRKILIAELFEEYASTFETLAILCCALRERNQKDFLSFFVSYKPGNAAAFYDGIRKSNSEFDFRSFARLPPGELIKSHIGGGAVTDVYRQSIPWLNRQIQDVTRLYLVQDGLTLRVFNKLKHSCVFVDDPRIPDQYVGNPPGTTGVEGEPDRVYVVTGLKPSGIPVLEANAGFAHKVYWNTRRLSIVTREVLAVATFLADHNLLFLYH